MKSRNTVYVAKMDNPQKLEHHADFTVKNWADELRKLGTANITLHLQ